MTRVDLPAGESVFLEGDPGDRLYVIGAGTVKLGRRSPDGRENLLSVLGPGEMFGELSLFDPGPRTATRDRRQRRDAVRAGARRAASRGSRRTRRSPSTCSRRSPTGCGAPTRRSATWSSPTCPAGSRRRCSTCRPGSANRPRTALRVAHGLTQEELAQLVGASRETVNKALADFTARGWVRREGRAVVLLDVERLERRAR